MRAAQRIEQQFGALHAQRAKQGFPFCCTGTSMPHGGPPGQPGPMQVLQLHSGTEVFVGRCSGQIFTDYQ